jgi:hypothetical protein
MIEMPETRRTIPSLPSAIEGPLEPSYILRPQTGDAPPALRFEVKLPKPRKFHR